MVKETEIHGSEIDACKVARNTAKQCLLLSNFYVAMTIMIKHYSFIPIVINHWAVMT